MSNIDKQALREELSNPAIGSKDHLRKLALSLLDELDVKEEQRANWFQMAQKLGEDLDAAERHIAETNRLNAELTARIEPMDRRIAELEHSETQLINERDYAESALNDAYKAVMGHAPEWSNWFSFENAIDEIELVCELWRNQTDDVIQFRQRIQELEARQIALPQRLSPEGYHIDEAYMVDDDEGEYLDRDAVIEAIRAAGIKVKGE
ncbi:ead/Ea22-like family protein [Salmonella enterica subsp. diarizonae serovar 53:z10:z]|nr:ead/Ea22-like family protein [Salmonella enterica subsp. diarizonae serovar 53:z10:z]EIF8218068.1 ead/Ea22-like family protein [Salmonella enterica]